MTEEQKREVRKRLEEAISARESLERLLQADPEEEDKGAVLFYTRQVQRNLQAIEDVLTEEQQ